MIICVFKIIKYLKMVTIINKLDLFEKLSTNSYFF